MKQPGSKSFILAKNWSRDPLFVVTSFLSYLSTSSEISTGHTSHLFRLIFSGYFFCAPKWRKNIKKIKRKSQSFPKKQRRPKKIEKRGAKEEQYLKEHIEKAKVRCVSMCCLVPCLCCSCYPPYLFFTHLAPCYPPYLFVTHTTGTWNILDQQR